MKFSLSDKASNDYRQLPPKLQVRVDKQLGFLLKDLHYPSLRAKKYDEARNIWQARITRGWRFYFQIEGDIYKILAITKHPE